MVFGIVPPDFISLNPRLNYVFTLFSFYILYISIVNGSIDSEYLFFKPFLQSGEMFFLCIYICRKLLFVYFGPVWNNNCARQLWL